VKFTVLVEVEVEREEGKFAGRDEVFERLEDAIVEAVDIADLHGLGADGSSTYVVVGTDMRELDRKELKHVYDEYDERVVQDLPGDENLRKENRHLRSQLKELNETLNYVKDRNLKLLEEQEAKATRIYQRDPASWGRDSKRTYIDDRLPVTYQWADNDTQGSFNIEFQPGPKGGDLEIRCNGWHDLFVKPYSSNVIIVKAVER